MSFQSILGETPYHLKPSELEYPSFFQDLNIDLIVEKILAKWADYPLLKYFYYPAGDEQTVNYRREVFQELEDENLQEAIIRFSRGMKHTRQYLEYRDRLLRLMDHQEKRKGVAALSSRTASEMKYQHLLYDGVKEYIHAVGILQEALKGYVFQSQGWKELKEYLQEYCSSGEYEKLQKDLQEMEEALSSLRFQIEVRQNKLTMYEEYDSADARLAMMERCGMGNFADEERKIKEKEMDSPFSNILEIKEFEGLLLSMLHHPHKEVFLKLKRFEKEHSEFASQRLVQFEEEVQVYLAAQRFFKEMREYGFSFTEGKCRQEEGSSLCLKENYDVALACKYCFTPEKVVTNDCYMAKQERFYVITGPNQGGKTTFARAVGQAVYFHQMGFPVAGTFAALPVFSVLMTHFPEEEDMEAGAGKLKEELSRLKPMLLQEKTRGFVILNELFTTATTYDAEIMGQRIMKRFLEREFCGIYVTHFQKLAEGDDRIVSLVAQVEDEDNKKRTYRIKRDKARGIAYAQTFAERYRLSREEIRKRIEQKEQAES